MRGRCRHDFRTLRRFEKGGKPRRFLVRIQERRGRDTILELGQNAEASRAVPGRGFRSGGMGRHGTGVGLRVERKRPKYWWTDEIG